MKKVLLAMGLVALLGACSSTKPAQEPTPAPEAVVVEQVQTEAVVVEQPETAPIVNKVIMDK
ncbi:hypothetical protein SAMN02745174_01043 [Cetobacterium ceti]|uniref:Uncharacterized protein n=1 Tax=Cetobacterium ceti TaxID=180163 RepID=A0A1T4M0Q7_9FUSO|nr:hypothetical protein [Cetobacterium ceti]SJZ60475.1 hypothetical protein SAMN02745174_01043 [Cetobacterium ceti]